MRNDGEFLFVPTFMMILPTSVLPVKATCAIILSKMGLVLQIGSSKATLKGDVVDVNWPYFGYVQSQ